MELRECRDAAHSVQIQIVIKVLIYMGQHPLHSGTVIFKCYLHRLFLRDDISYTFPCISRSTDLAILGL